LSWIIELLTSGALDNSRGTADGVSLTQSLEKVTSQRHMCQTRNIFCIDYIGHRQHIVCMLCPTRIGEMIRIQIDQLLKERRRSFYWLAKETGVSHTTLWRLKKDKAQGITFNTLEKICQTLKCQPGDVLRVGRDKQTKRRK
jgi:putative transcriptional regulator